ncbi:MAG: VanW family protein [Clostridia bacterium]|nr:VanW family protein [Clostridia bacterium]
MTLTNDNITNGVSISGVYVSGLSKEEAMKKIQSLYDEKLSKDLLLSYQDYETSINPSSIELKYEIEKAVDNALLIGRKNNIFQSNYDVLFTLIFNKNIDVQMNLNDETLKQTVDGITANLPGVLVDSSYYIEDDELIISKGKTGVVVDSDILINKIKENLTDVSSNESRIEISVLSKDPQPIDIDAIHEEVCVEPQNASYTKEPFEVHPEVNGISFDLEAARAMLQEDKEEYIIKLKITIPEITLSQIGDQAFPDRLGHCTTRYDVSDTNRTTNLIIACKKINGMVLAPGETFSYNKALGERTVAAGYRNGKIYSGGEVVDGIGGGICQISSTLYNAVLKANLSIVERRNHQFVTSYLEAGKDATVVYGLTDFRFKNTRKYPIRITASANAGIATVSIFGLKEETEYQIEISSRVISSIPFSTNYIDDNSLPAGTEEVKQKGCAGTISETYLIKYLNGAVVESKLISRDTYNAMQRIIRRGPEGNSSSNSSTTTPTPSTPSAPPIENETPTTPTTPSTDPTPSTDTNTTTNTTSDGTADSGVVDNTNTNTSTNIN